MPKITPYGIVPSLKKAYRCQLVDSETIIFQCDEKPIPISEANLDGGFAFTAEETLANIQWARDVKEYAKKRCK